ncbi:unnamed protein product [Haemonchus placei]|uniref:Secreted protein n=1 Tax=Haemonchus placei TaxID=6290 RepID=A0A0N4X611_HAEPC|nr:unnamed protein product [Haemonchus placei]
MKGFFYLTLVFIVDCATTGKKVKVPDSDPTLQVSCTFPNHFSRRFKMLSSISQHAQNLCESFLCSAIIEVHLLFTHSSPTIILSSDTA